MPLYLGKQYHTTKEISSLEQITCGIKKFKTKTNKTYEKIKIKDSL